MQANEIIRVPLIWWRFRHKCVCKSESASVQRSANQLAKTICSPTNGEASRGGTGLYTNERSAKLQLRLKAWETERREKDTPFKRLLLQLSGKDDISFKLLI